MCVHAYVCMCVNYTYSVRIQVQDAGTDLQYRVYYREDGVSIFTEDVANGSNIALLPVVLGRTYEVWVTSILDGEKSQPSDTLTLSELRTPNLTYKHKSNTPDS